MTNIAHRVSDDPTSTVELGSLRKEILAWPEDIARPQAPDGTPQGYGMELWYGTRRTRITELVEYRLWSTKEKLLLRIRATRDNALVGIYDADLRDDGSTRPVRLAYSELRIKTAELCADKLLDGLAFIKTTGIIVTRSPKTISRKAQVTTPPLFEVMYRSMLYCSALVWYPGVDRSTYMLNWQKPDAEEAQYSKGDMISVRDLLRAIERGTRVQWWDDQGDRSRAVLAQYILRLAADFAREPPAWKWWAGTHSRTDGFVRRSTYNGAYCPAGVRCWDNTKQSGIKTVVRRFVRPDDERQQDLFA